MNIYLAEKLLDERRKDWYRDAEQDWPQSWPIRSAGHSGVLVYEKIGLAILRWA